MRALTIGLGAVLAMTSAACADDENPEIASGLPAPMDGVYTDFGPAPTDAEFQALMAFPLRDGAGLSLALERMYDPAHPEFRKYMSAEAFLSRHAPADDDLKHVEQWLSQHGMTVARTTTNRMLFHFTGTVGQFNEAFEIELHTYERENPAKGNDPIPVYGSTEPLRAPQDIADRVVGVITVDLPPSTDDLPGESGDIVTDPPPDVEMGKTVSQIAHAYDIDDLHAAGYLGQGVKLGLVVGATFKFKDLQSFWQTFGIARDNPTVIETMEPVATRYLETTLDVEWAGALAPQAELVAYEGPDARNTSILFTFTEAIARDEVSVLATSFAHREETEAVAIRDQFNEAAKVGAALGISIVVASGDSSRTDIPSTSPYVTCVGGTELQLGAGGEVQAELAWSGSGSGAARSFAMPAWQQGVVTDAGGKRACADVALNASSESAYWVYYLKNWKLGAGTSFSAPVFGAMLAVINSYRADQGQPEVGWLNPILYRSPEVQAAFRDVVEGETPFHSAGVGWDYPSGWGAPLAAGLAQVLP